MRLLLKVLLLSLLLLSLIGVVSAQDLSTEPLAPTNTTAAAPSADPTIAVVEQPVIVSPVGEPDPVQVPVASDEIRISLGQFIAGIFSAIVLGAIAGGGAVITAVRSIIKNVGQNTLLLDAMEKLYNSVPAPQRETGREAALALKDIGEIADKVTDGLPNTPLPAAG